jgi:hypothetical protein
MSLLRRLLRPKPNPTKIDFVIAGTQKGGTTALDHYLRSHPGLCMAARKEVHFFDEDRYFNADHRPRRADYADYHALFPDDREGKVTGEATPIYMYWRDAPPRLREYRPDLRIILVLRNPVDRAFSHWNMERQRGGDDLDFWTAITTEEERCRSALPRQHRVWSYVDRGFYSRQIERLWLCFPPEQVLVLRNGELRQEPAATLARVCDFLGVDRLPAVAHEEVFAHPYAEGLSAREREYLCERYAEEIDRLEAMLGWDLDAWRRASD